MTKRTPIIPDLPPVDLDPTQLRRFLEAVRESLQTLQGRRGNDLDRALTLRDGLDFSVISRTPGGGYIGIGGGGAVGPGAGPYVPDLTKPPTPTGLAAVSLFRGAYVSWDFPAYTEGHGNAYTRIYVAQYGGSGPLPTFAVAILAGTAGGATSMYVHDAATGAQLHFWATWVSQDGEDSASPAGGLNGVQVTVGTVGSSDLGALSVQAENIAARIGGGNLCGNSGFEVDTDNDGAADGWGPYNGSPGTEPTTTFDRVAGRISGFAQRIEWTGSNTTQKGIVGTNRVRGGWQPNQTYTVSWYARSTSGTPAASMAMGWNTSPATIVTRLNPPMTAVLQRYAFTITWGASVESSGTLYPYAYGACTGGIAFDDVQIQEGDTITEALGTLAAQTIVAGDGAIANFAITNALIANLAVDDAKIASLSVAKLVAGYMQVGAYLRSTNYDGLQGFSLGSDGILRAVDAVLSGTIYASAGSIGGWVISGPDLRSADYVPGTSGVRLTGGATGGIEAYSGTFGGNLSGASGTFSGTLTADKIITTRQLAVDAVFSRGASQSASIPDPIGTVYSTGGAGAGYAPFDVTDLGTATVVIPPEAGAVTSDVLILFNMETYAQDVHWLKFTLERSVNGGSYTVLWDSSAYGGMLYGTGRRAGTDVARTTHWDAARTGTVVYKLRAYQSDGGTPARMLVVSHTLVAVAFKNTT